MLFFHPPEVVYQGKNIYFLFIYRKHEATLISCLLFDPYLKVLLFAHLLWRSVNNFPFGFPFFVKKVLAILQCLLIDYFPLILFVCLLLFSCYICCFSFNDLSAWKSLGFNLLHSISNALDLHISGWYTSSLLVPRHGWSLHRLLQQCWMELHLFSCRWQNLKIPPSVDLLQHFLALLDRF